MVSSKPSSITKEARVVFDKIKLLLEASHPNQFVAVEPISGNYFLGTTLSQAIGASRLKYPDRLAHAFRLGHQAAVHFGLHIR